MVLNVELPIDTRIKRKEKRWKSVRDTVTLLCYSPMDRKGSHKFGNIRIERYPSTNGKPKGS